MASCSQCRNPNLALVPGERNTCTKCDEVIYGGERLALKCRQCNEYFHDFCLQRTTPVSFTFADINQRIQLGLVDVHIRPVPPLCKACGDPMRGSSIYTTPNRDISVHPSCAVNFLTMHNGSNNQVVPQHLRNFLRVRNEFNDMVIEVYREGPGSVGKCMLCDRGPENIYVTARWWYVITRGRRLVGGCHVGCLKRRIARNRNNNRNVNLEAYYNSINNRGNATRIETAQNVLELVIGVTLTPPLSNVLSFALKIMVAAVCSLHFIPIYVNIYVFMIFFC